MSSTIFQQNSVFISRLAFFSSKVHSRVFLSLLDIIVSQTSSSEFLLCGCSSKKFFLFIVDFFSLIIHIETTSLGSCIYICQVSRISIYAIFCSDSYKVFFSIYEFDVGSLLQGLPHGNGLVSQPLAPSTIYNCFFRMLLIFILHIHFSF